MAILNELWEAEDVPASVLVGTCIKKYGMDIFEWDAETIRLEIFQDFKVSLSQNSLDKIQALITAIATDKFYLDYSVFESVGLVLSDDDPAVGTLQQLNPEQIAWAVVEVLNNDDSPRAWSEDVKAYIREVLRDYGFIKSPEELSFCDYDNYYLSPVIPKDLEKSVNIEQNIKQNKIKIYISYREKLIKKYSKYS